MYAYLWKKHGIKNETNENKTAKGIVFLKLLSHWNAPQCF
jgi:hypothetical protein